MNSTGYHFNQLVCVEMNPNTFNRLAYNIAVNFHGNSKCLNIALTDHCGQIDLILGAGSTSDSIFQNEKKPRENYIA